MKKQTEFKLDKRDSVWFQDNTAAVNLSLIHISEPTRRS